MPGWLKVVEPVPLDPGVKRSILHWVKSLLTCLLKYIYLCIHTDRISDKLASELRGTARVK